MPKRINPDDIVGTRFGKLTVIKCVGRKKSRLYYECRCDCGNKKEVYRYNLLSGFTTSCQRCMNPYVIEEYDHLRYFCASGGSFIFDREDLKIVESRRWHISAFGYVVHTIREKSIIDGKHNKHHVEWLTRVLLDAPNGTIIDHINGDKLDNRRSNLRIATSSQNNRNQRLRADNTLGYKGIYYVEKLDRYMAELRADGVKHYLGIYKTPEEAAKAYDEGARRIHGEFACVNFPLPGERGCRDAVNY